MVVRMETWLLLLTSVYGGGGRKSSSKWVDGSFLPYVCVLAKVLLLEEEKSPIILSYFLHGYGLSQAKESFAFFFL